MPARRTGGLTHDGFVRIGEERYACKVSNMSVTGAVLSFGGPVELPARFMLALTPLGQVVRGCTMTWEEGEQVGVVFGDATS